MLGFMGRPMVSMPELSFGISLNRLSPIRYDRGNDEQQHRTDLPTLLNGCLTIF
jgi:hypothetical protein